MIQTKIAKFFTYTNEENSLRQSLLFFYKRVCALLLPLIFINLLLHFLDFYTIHFYEITQGLLTVFVSILVFNSNEWIKKYFITIHFLFLFSVTLINVIWFLESQEPDSFIGLLLNFFLCGILLVRSTITIIYFLLVLLLMTILSFQFKMFDPKFTFYMLFFGLVITGFSFWRERLLNKLNLAKDGYKNLFNDSSELIFITNKNLEIIELNKVALDYTKHKFTNGIVGKLFNEVFCISDEKEITKLREAIAEALSGQKAKFEANFALADSNDFIPKEFTIRPSSYFDKKVLIISIRLIKDQREYEQKLIESKENIAKVLENIPSFIYNIAYHKNGNHQINYVSNKVKEVYGVDVDEYITLIKSGRLNELFYHEDRDEVTLIFNDVINTVKQNRIKFRIVRNGEVRWVEEKIFPKKIDDSGIIFLFGIVTDITDQVDAIQAIEASEKRYRQIFERNMAGVYKTHVNGTILESNLAFARILGYQNPNEIIGKNIQEMYLEKSNRKAYIDRLRAETSINNHISNLKHKDGRKLILNNNVSIQPDEDGNLNIIEGTLIDITELEDTAYALKMSEEKYRLLFEEANTGILLLSTQNNESFIIDLNLVGLQLFGYETNQLVGLKLTDIASNGEELQKRMTLLNQSTNEREKVELEWKFKRKNGQEFFAEVSFISISLGQEKIVQAVIKDISERKKNEQELLDSQRSFKNIVDNSPGGILIFTNDKLVYLNPSGERIYKDLLNNKTEDLYHVFPENSKFIIKDLINEKSNESNSYTEINLGNNIEQRKFSLSVVRTVYNNKKSSLFLMQDITLQTEYHAQKLRAEIAEETNKNLQQEIVNHRKTQAELLEKTFWLNALFESSYNLFILSLDINYKLSSFNENFRRMIKNSLEIEVKIGDNFLDLFKPRKVARKKIEDRLKRVLKGDTLEFVSHFSSKKGEVWVESFLNPVNLGQKEIVEISLISHEITDKIEAQRKTKLSEANNRAILLAMPDILYKVNKDGYFTDYRINQPRGLDQLDGFLSTQDIVGKHVSKVFNDSDVALKFMGHIKSALLKNELITDTIEFRRKEDKNQQVIYYENRFSKMNEDEVIVLSRNITETIEHEAKLIESVKEKEILLKEVHHRVKNNLQVINSILNLQSSYVSDPKTLEIINESQNRIRSMSYIHESLYQTKDFAAINFADYITNLVQNLVHSYQLYHNKIGLDLDIEPVKLALDQAIPCGLILNELISNALKYAYPGVKKGKIAVHVHEEKNKIFMQVQDFGNGLPAGFNVENSESLGLSLVYTLVDQLDGELILKTDGGTKFLITFEKQNF